MDKNIRIAIIGGGPAGLSAGMYLEQKGYENYVIYERLNRVGGKCNTAQEFIACIRDFEANPRPRFNAYSRQMFLDKYSEEAVIENFRQVLSDN